LSLLWGLAIAWLSLTPSPPEITGTLLGWDKFQHASAYALLAILALLAKYGDTRGAKVSDYKTLGLVILFGAAIEVAQGMLTPSRSAELFDLAANMIGSFSGYFVLRLFRSRREPSVEDESH
jgi:VanZ family protein